MALILLLSPWPEPRSFGGIQTICRHAFCVIRQRPLIEEVGVPGRRLAVQAGATSARRAGLYVLVSLLPPVNRG